MKTRQNDSGCTVPNESDTKAATTAPQRGCRAGDPARRRTPNQGALERPMGDLVNPVIKSPAVGGSVEEIQIVRRDKALRIIQEIHSCGATEYSLHAPGIQIHHLPCNRLVRKAD